MKVKAATTKTPSSSPSNNGPEREAQFDVRRQKVAHQNRQRKSAAATPNISPSSHAEQAQYGDDGVEIRA